jgi:hypothetical protein
MAARAVGCQAPTIDETHSFSYGLDDIAKYSAHIKDIPPEKR